MKQTAKILSLVMAFLLLMLLAVSCVDTGDGGNDTTTDAAVVDDTTDSLYDENGYLKSSLPDELDWGGEEVAVLWWNDVERPEFYVEDTNGEMVNDAIYTRNANVEAKMGVTLVWDDIKGQYNNGVGAAYAKHVENAYKSGESAWDIISAHSRTIALTAMNGLCTDLLDLDYLDFEKPWWPKVMTDTATIGNSMFFVSGDVSTNSIHMMYVIFFNKEIVANSQLTDPAALALEGNWTVEAMQSLTTELYQDLDSSNSKNENDFYGFTSLNWHLDAIYYGADLRQAEKDEVELLKISDDYFSEKAVNLCDIMGAWLATEDTYINSSNYTKPFINGNALMTLCRHKDLAETIAGTDMSFGILPAPKYNTDQENYVTVVGNPVSFYSIFVNTKDANRSAAVLECWASEAYRTTTPALFDTTMKSRYAETSTESQIYDMVREGIVFDFGRLFNGQLQGGMSDNWDNACVNGTSWQTGFTVAKKLLPRQLKDITDAFKEVIEGQ